VKFSFMGDCPSGSDSDIILVLAAAEARELHAIAEAGRAAARTHQPDAETESQTCQIVKAAIRIETSNPGSSTPSLAT
jgi:hypothetical protein